MNTEEMKGASKPVISSLTPTSPCPVPITLTQDPYGDFGYRVTDGGQQYDILRCGGLLERSNPVLASSIGNRRAFVLMDSAVHRLYGGKIFQYLEHWGIDSYRFVLPEQEISEFNKDVSVAAETFITMRQHGYKKSPANVLVLFGGGVVLDAGGFIAKAFRRGAPFISVPTTLLAMCDAAISPKCAVNVSGDKNAWSALHYPEVVLYDPAFLETLDHAAFQDGLAEVAKVAVVGSSELFTRLTKHSLAELKVELCSGSSGSTLDKAIRVFLELKWTGPFYGNNPASIRSFGHSFSRELECFSGFSLRHGQAVAIEMAVATRLARNLGHLPGAACEAILELFTHLGFPQSSTFCDATTLWEAVFREMAEGGENFYFPVPIQVGKGNFVSQFSLAELRAAIAGAPEEAVSAFAE